MIIAVTVYNGFPYSFFPEIMSALNTLSKHIMLILPRRMIRRKKGGMFLGQIWSVCDSHNHKEAIFFLFFYDQKQIQFAIWELVFASISPKKPPQREHFSVK
jgi:hypothetical protein